MCAKIIEMARLFLFVGLLICFRSCTKHIEIKYYNRVKFLVCTNVLANEADSNSDVPDES